MSAEEYIHVYVGTSTCIVMEAAVMASPSPSDICFNTLVCMICNKTMSLHP